MIHTEIMANGKLIRRIVSNPKILGGKPVIKGTRISVELILSLIASDMSEREILEDYPHLKPADLKAALEYGALLAGSTRAGTSDSAADTHVAR